MDRYKGYYQALINMNSEKLIETERLIWLDVERTSNTLSSESKTLLHRILFCFVKRNLEISYCQGMNFIVNFFHKNGFEEEQIFWILCYILEQSVSLSYYINLIPVFVDIELISDMLRLKNPELMHFVQLKSFDLNFILIPLFVTLLTNVKNPVVF